ncbi:O-antigen ligase family protein [Sporocytophaga myxococcoides]|uniref:O-antigen ligase family protein n=1 Tax=Sporocytophaga myxococcoides TaxID=153721 RepID=UPI00068535B9|nr:O-antigen ligase family protein [Sporocytophaga myxococcoides]
MSDRDILIENVKKYGQWPLLLLFAYFLGLLFAKGGIIITAAAASLPLILVVFAIIFSYPLSGMIMAMVVGLIVNGVTRYVSAPLGTSLDIVLVISIFSALFSVSYENIKKLNNSLIWVLLVWTGFTMLEILNPEAVSFEAWFYAVRAISFYIIFLIILTFLVLKTEKFIDVFINLWMIGALVAALYGMKQMYIGLDHVEKAWLETAADTHILFGKIRYFSFCSDAGQFGAFMSFSTLVAVILSLKSDSTFKSVFYFIVAVLCFWGMAISGTRGAMFVFVGVLFYLLLTKNFRIFTLGFIVMAAIFCFLRFTFIGQSNYQIQRMRSAVNPQSDPSFKVRLENQRKLKAYLASRPIGGGIGTIGYWGSRFSPGTFLAETPPDSHYVRIWAETGIVGLTIHILTLLFILARGFYLVYNLRNPYLKQKMMALYAGVFGILVASYGNQVLAQFPTIVFWSISVGVIFLAPSLDTDKTSDTVKPVMY